MEFRRVLFRSHTHSEPYPKPSKIDRDMISNMLKDTIMEINFLITIIVGTHDYWVGYQKGKKLTRLKYTEKQKRGLMQKLLTGKWRVK